jgi:hypothetical protein
LAPSPDSHDPASRAPYSHSTVLIGQFALRFS